MIADLPLARRDLIAARLFKGQAVVANDLADEFDVSEDAIRRDLRALAAEGRCRRVYGGALPLTPGREPIAARVRQGTDRKQKLAQAAAATVRPGELVFIDSGSTNLAIIDHLPEDADVTVVTNAIDIAGAVLRRQDLRLIVVGGTANPLIGGCVDATAVQAVERFRFDRAFLGACAVSATSGIGAFHYPDATFKRAVLASAEHVSVLATSEKLTERAPHKVAELREIGDLVVEAGLTAEQRAALESGGCHLIVADPG